MATLVAIGYPDQTTAEAARQTVQSLEADLIIEADQVAAISRDQGGKYHVTTTHGGASSGGGAAWGGFWGLLFGMLFFVPFAGLALGAGFGALFGHLGKKGIDEAFQQQVRDHLQPGTSALFMIIEKATPDKAIAALEQVWRHRHQDLAVRRGHSEAPRGADTRTAATLRVDAHSPAWRAIRHAGARVHNGKHAGAVIRRGRGR